MNASQAARNAIVEGLVRIGEHGIGLQDDAALDAYSSPGFRLPRSER